MFKASRRTMLDALVTEKALRVVNGYDTSEFISENAEQLGLKNVCARVHPELASEIDEICQLLGISKRRFLEAAFIEAVDKARTIMEQEGMFDRYEEDGTPLRAELELAGEPKPVKEAE